MSTDLSSNNAQAGPSFSSSPVRTDEEELEAIDKALASRRRRSSIPAILGLAGHSRSGQAHRSTKASEGSSPKSGRRGSSRQPAESPDTPSGEIVVNGDYPGREPREIDASPNGNEAEIDNTPGGEGDEAQELEEEMRKLQEETARYERDRPGKVKMKMDGKDVNPLDQEDRAVKQEYVWDGESVSRRCIHISVTVTL